MMLGSVGTLINTKGKNHVAVLKKRQHT